MKEQDLDRELPALAYCTLFSRTPPDAAVHLVRLILEKNLNFSRGADFYRECYSQILSRQDLLDQLGEIGEQMAGGSTHFCAEEWQQILRSVVAQLG